MLTELESKVLRVVEVAGELSLEQVSRRVGAKSHQVRYALAKFERNGTIRPRLFINTFTFGLERYAIFFTLSARQGSVRKNFIEYLKRSPHVVLLLEIGGEFQFEINVVARSLHDFVSFITEVSEKFSNIIANRIISPQVEHRFFGTKALAPYLKMSEEPRYGITEKGVELDALDLKLLDSAAKVGAVRLREIARRTGIAVSTVEQRMKRLQKSGVITGSTHLVEQVGIQEFILLLYTQGSGQSLKSDLLEFCRGNERVHFFVESLGNWDFEIGIAVRDSAEVTGVVEELYEKFRNRIVHLKSIPIYGRHKVIDFSL